MNEFAAYNLKRKKMERRALWHKRAVTTIAYLFVVLFVVVSIVGIGYWVYIVVHLILNAPTIIGHAAGDVVRAYHESVR